MEIQAYFEEWSRLPGERVRMAISTRCPEVRASLEKLTRGPAGADAVSPDAFGEQIEGLDVVLPGVEQQTALGSYAELPLPEHTKLAGATVHVLVWPTTPASGEFQTIWAVGHEQAWLSLGIRRNELSLRVDARIHPLGTRLESHTWYSLALGLAEGDGGVTAEVDVRQLSGLPLHDPRTQSQVTIPGSLPEASALRLAADEVTAVGSPVRPYNGKIEAPSFFAGGLSEQQRGQLHADPNSASPDIRWDLSKHLDSARVSAVGAPDGALCNGGDRGVTGHNWSGESDSFLEVPAQYASVHFHDDDMVDSGWDYNLEFDLPEALESGLYAVRLEAGDIVDHYPLFVRSRPDETADVLLLFPTNTYLAYANDRFAGADLSGIMSHEKKISPDEEYLNAHPEFGLSAYDTHSDGSPVRYSSRRRPLVNVRPHYPNFLTGTYRHFAVDLFLVEWLERSGLRYHVATDEDLHAEGDQLLSRYKVAVTGSHPEYWTGPALQSLDSYLRSGGKMMYLGGNGFYWVTTHHSERPWIVEIRRDNGGLRSWDPPPGERTHVATGEPGGLWRYRGRSPNTICGIAFATEGFSAGQGYRRTESSKHGPGSRFFAGIDDEVIGDFGYVLGGAAGDECDRFDLRLGSPPQTQVLASATGFGREYLIVNEDVLLPVPDQDGPHRPDMVRSDMVYLPINGGGAVFSVGSIAFAGAMAWNGFDNNAATLVNNVLKEFVAGT